jgi:hypothetical protein
MVRLHVGLAAAMLTTAAARLAAAPALTRQEAVAIATNAYVYGYSFVTTDVTRIQMAKDARPTPLRVPLRGPWQV